MAATTKVTTSGNPDIDGLLYDQKWTDKTVTFSFPTSASQIGYSVTGFSTVNNAQKAAIREILKDIAAVTGLNFVEVSGGSGTLRFGEHSNIGTAYAWMPTTLEQGGDVWMNATKYDNPVAGSYAYMTLLHEIGHALGLDHGHEGTGVLPTNHDSLEYSVMTYRSFVGASLTGYTVRDGSYPLDLMMADIQALQYLYGANYNTNSGNSVYTFSSTTGVMSINGVAQDSSSANRIFRTIWDGGGIDTYDLSNYTTNLTINLEPGAWSTFSTAQLADLGGGVYPGKFARGNVANAELFQGNTASLIENANGGSGNDTIIGNQADNVLRGNAGNDTLEGGLGNDTLIGGSGIDYCVLDVYRAECVVTFDSLTGIFTLTSLLGIDTAQQIEFVTFRDGTFAIESLAAADTTAPTLAATSPADNAGSVVPSANIVLTFSETVVRGTGNIVIYNASNVAVFTIAATDTSQVSISGSKVTINPSSDLAPSTGYYVLVDAGAFKDASGNAFTGIVSADALNFTTSSATSPPPPTEPGKYGTEGADKLDGTTSADVIFGLGGDDVIRGLAGDDRLYGGAGKDTLQGGQGADQLWGGLGKDTLTGGVGKDTFYFDAFGAANADTITDFSVADDTIGLVQSAFAALSLGNLAASAFATGSKATTAQHRIIYDKATGNLFYDADGSGSGAQELIATLGKNLAITNADFTVVAAPAGSSEPTPPTEPVDPPPTEPDPPTPPTDPTGPGKYGTEGADKLDGTAAADLIYGLGGDDVIRGLAGDDRLYGGAGKDTLQAGQGADQLWGGLGKDTLTGGQGKDTFYFDAFGTANADTITDFSVADDTIGLVQSAFTALAVGNLAASAFTIGNKATDAQDRIIYDKATGNLLYDADGSGSGAQELIATLSKNLAMTHADFIIIA